MKTLLRSTAVLALTLGLAMAASAQPAPGKPGPAPKAPCGGHGGPGIAVQKMFDLGLSDKQVEKMLKIRYDHQLEMLPTMREHFQLRQELDGLRSDPVGNEAKMKKIASRLAEMRVEGQVSRQKMQQNLWNVLTPDQQKQVGKDAFFAHPGFGMDGHRNWGEPGSRVPGMGRRCR